MEQLDTGTEAGTFIKGATRQSIRSKYNEEPLVI